MFNLKRFKIVKELKNSEQKSNWLKFSSLRNNEKNKSELLDSILDDNKFIEEDLKIRSMVENMLKKEFSDDIKNIKDYDFLVDSVVNKLKQKQLGETIEQEIE